MPVDLTAIRALLASVAGFTEGPWEIADSSRIRSTAGVPVTGYVAPNNQPLFAAAPDLHRELTEAVAEVERLRAHNARMVALLNVMADALSERGGFWDAVCAHLGTNYATSEVFRRLAAGEVDDV